MPHDKRKHERYELTEKVKSETIHIVRGINVSMNGIRILTDRALTTNHTINMQFTIPGITNAFDAEAKVVWQQKLEKKNEFDTGLKFNKISMKKREDME